MTGTELPMSTPRDLDIIFGIFLVMILILSFAVGRCQDRLKKI